DVYKRQDWSGIFGVEDTGNCSNPAIAVTPDGVAHIVYQRDGANLYYKNGRYGGWSGAQFLGAGSLPSLVSDSFYLHLAFAEGGSVFYRRRNPTTGAWITSLAVFSAVGNTSYSNPSICLDSSSKIYIACRKVRVTGTATYSIVMKISSDNGASWSNEITLYSGTTANAYPKIVAEGSSYIHTVYSNGITVWYILYDISSGTFGTPVNISLSTATSNEPDITIDSLNKKVWVVWQESRNGPPPNYDIIYSVQARSGSGGSWDSPETVFSSFEGAQEPKITVAGGKPCSVWKKASFFTYSDIYYSFRGVVWEGGALTSGSTNSKNPDITSGPGALFHTVWVTDNGTGSYKLRYAVK
ncbi:MAG: exo-alpha-sialidase, partial [Planctomycetota bacterium]|nr:exo-alpha-sialidase [Planctomycetota bacterium]